MTELRGTEGNWRNTRKIPRTALESRSYPLKDHFLCENGRKLRFLGWWRGLDSNQRTLARADLQSAAFNHSATSPRDRAGHEGPVTQGRRAKWRRGCSVSTRSSLDTASSRCELRELTPFQVPKLRRKTGAGEGNRTLVVSLEGFCSTIELHPLALSAMPPACARRQLISLVDLTQGSALPSDSHDEPGRYRCILHRSPFLVARRDACGAMARLID